MGTLEIMKFLNLMYSIMYCRKKLPNQSRKVKKTQSRPKNCGRLPEKHKRRKILKDPTFIFTSAINKKTENKTEKNTSMKDIKDSLIPQNELQRRQLNTSTNGGPHRLQGCGEQFRNGAHLNVSNSLNMDDTTPEELAAYFDQLVHIPKPMSLMAEMMYT